MQEKKFLYLLSKKLSMERKSKEIKRYPIYIIQEHEKYM